MSRKSRDSGAKGGTCNKCGATSRSTIHGKPHRRCSGDPNSPDPRRKGDPLPGAQKGRWG